MHQNTPGPLDILAALLKGVLTFHLTACTAGVCVGFWRMVLPMSHFLKAHPKPTWSLAT